MTKPTGFTGGRERWLATAAAALTIALTWEAVAQFYPDYLMPSLGPVLIRLGRQAASASFLATVGVSLWRLAVGYLLACGIGLTMGLLAAPVRGLRLYLRALVGIIQSVPPVAWIPLLVIILGFGEVPLLVVISVASFSPMVLSVINATEMVDQNRLWVARQLGASKIQQVTKVYAPEVFPALINGAQIAFVNAWRSLIAAEMIGGANNGLGWSITLAGEIADMPGVVLGIVVIGTLATLIERLLLDRVKGRLLRWRESQ